MGEGSVATGTNQDATVAAPDAVEPALGAVVSTERVTGGETIVDPAGNQITITSWIEWPAALSRFDPYGNLDYALFGALASGSPGARLVAADVEVCAGLEQSADQELFRSRFQPIASGANLDDSQHSSASMILGPVLTPKFLWPTAGTCTRGWQALRWSGSGDPDFQFTAVSDDAATFGEQHVYVWTDVVRIALGRPAEEPADGAAAMLQLGQVGSIESGGLRNWTFTVHGWRDVPPANGRRTHTGVPLVAALEGTSLVAVNLDVCAGEEPRLPSFGLQVDGWNVIGQFRRGLPWGVGFEEIDVPEPGQCASGWISFEVPNDLNPTGMFITDESDPTASWLWWQLDAQQLLAPEVTGFPGPERLARAEMTCGIEHTPLVLASEAAQGKPWPPQGEFDVVHAIAVAPFPGHVDVYLADRLLAPEDIPIGQRADDYLLTIAINADSGDPIRPGEFRKAKDDGRKAEVAIARGEAAGFVFLDATIVEVNAITDDVICGTFTVDGAGGTITGPFAAPFWPAE